LTGYRSGAGANRATRSFVFATITPDKKAAAGGKEQTEEERGEDGAGAAASKKRTIKQNKPPAAKKVKLDRTLKPASKVPTIFNLL
jgi:hypothetical protein